MTEDRHESEAAIAAVESPAPRKTWSELFRSDPEAVTYQSPEWADALCGAGGYADCSRLYTFSDGLQLVVPMAAHKRVLGLVSTAASQPSGWGMGGFVSNGNVQVGHIRAVFRDIAGLPFARVSIRPNPRTGALWAAAAPPNVFAVPRRAHAIDLTAGFDEVWTKGFRSETKRQVRKAERLGVEVERDTSGALVPVFYDLLVKSFDRWAQKQHEPAMLARLRGRMRDPIEKFQAIARDLGEGCHFWVARVEGRPAATILVLQHGNANYSRGALDPEALGSSGANELLHKLAIEEACKAGCRHYHLGETGDSSSLAQFKEKFGAVPFSYAEYHIERLPITRIDAALRGAVKRVIGFKDQ